MSIQSFLRSRFASILGTSIVFLVAVYFALFFTKAPAYAQNKHIVTIYHDGETQVIDTDAPTVGVALARAGVSLGASDAVEPSQSTQLSSEEFNINVYRARPVVILDGTQRYDIMSPYQSPKEIAKAAGLQIYDQDILTLHRIDNFIASNGVGLELDITRAIPVTMVLYGQTIQTHTQAQTVAGFLAENHIKLAPQDGVAPAGSQAITPNMTIDIYRNGQATVNVQQTVPFTVQTIQNADEPVGYKQVQQAGVNGAAVVTYQIQLKNGKEVSRSAIQTVVTQQPTQEIDIVGTKLVDMNISAEKSQVMSEAGIADSDFAYVDYIVTHESGWRVNALNGTNPATDTYGLCQSNPGGKMASAGADWLTNPVTQLKWCNGYAISRYGSWAAAYNHWYTHHNW